MLTPNELTPPPHFTAPNPTPSRLRSLLLLVSFLLVTFLSARLLANRVMPSLLFKTMTAAELEADILRKFDEGTDEDEPAEVRLQLAQIPNYDAALQLYKESTQESDLSAFNAFMTRHRDSMRLHQELAYTVTLVFRRYNDSKVFEGFFAVIAQMDPSSAIGKRAAFLQQLERSKHTPSVSQEEREMLFGQLNQWVEADDSRLFRYMAGVIANNHGREEEARHYYEPLLRDWKVGPLLLRRDLGKILQRLGRSYDALVFRQETVKHFPTGEDYGLLAASNETTHRPTEALEASLKAVEISPNDAKQWAMRTQILCRSGNFEEAIVAAKKTLGIDPTQEMGWSYQAAALEGLERPKEAVLTLRSGLEQLPANQTLLSMLSKLQAFDQQQRNFNISKRKRSEPTPLLTNQRQLESTLLKHYAAGDESSAHDRIQLEWRKLKAFPKAMHLLESEHPLAIQSFVLQNRQQLLLEHEIAFLYAFERRIQFFQQRSSILFALIAKLVPDSQIGKLALLVSDLDSSEFTARFSEDEINDRLHLLEERLRTAAVSPLELWLGGIVCRSLDQPELGVQFYERLSNHWSPGPALMHQTYANHLDALERHSEALKHRKLATSLEHGPWAIQSYGHTLENLYRYRDAQEWHQKALKQSPNDSYKWSSLGYSLMKSGQHQQAIRCFKLAIKRDYKNENAWLNWAQSLCAMEQPAQAHQLLRLAKLQLPGVNRIETRLEHLSNYAFTSEGDITLDEALN